MAWPPDSHVCHLSYWLEWGEWIAACAHAACSCLHACPACVPCVPSAELVAEQHGMILGMSPVAGQLCKLMMLTRAKQDPWQRAESLAALCRRWPCAPGGPAAAAWRTPAYSNASTWSECCSHRHRSAPGATAGPGAPSGCRRQLSRGLEAAGPSRSTARVAPGQAGLDCSAMVVRCHIRAQAQALSTARHDAAH